MNYTTSTYNRRVQQLQLVLEQYDKQHKVLVEAGLDEEEITCVLNPLCSLCDLLKTVVKRKLNK